MKPADEELELKRLLAAEADGRDSEIALLRGRGPDAAELASLASRLALQGVDVAPPSGSPPVEFPWKKWAIGGAGGGAAVLLWLALRAPQPVAAPSQSVAPSPEPVPAAAGVDAPAGVKLPPRLAAPARAGGVDAPSPGPSSAAPVTSEAPASLTTPPVTAAAATDASSGPSTPRPAAGGQHSSATSAGPVTRNSVGTDLVPDQGMAPTEIELLRDARFALKQSPARALDLTDQHVRRYPGGKLAQERELIAITALVALGRRTAALSRGAAFERAFPGSPYVKQLNELLR